MICRYKIPFFRRSISQISLKFGGERVDKRARRLLSSSRRFAGARTPMSAEIGSVLAEQLVDNCRRNAAAIASAWSRLTGGQLTLEVGESGQLGSLPDGDIAGPGLIVMLMAGEQAALVMLPQTTGILPGWYAEPNATGQSVLATLSQELAPLVLPGAQAAKTSRAQAVAHLGEAVTRAAPAGDALALPLKIAADSGKSAVAWLVWPATRPANVFVARGNSPPTAAQQSAAAGATTIDALPTYARSLLRIKVPVIVTLAAKKQPISRIVELGPGSIIQFDKSCEEMLDLHVADQTVAEGEAVKVGDKFGIRVTSLVVPGERFKPVRRR